MQLRLSKYDINASEMPSDRIMYKHESVLTSGADVIYTADLSKDHWPRPLASTISLTALHNQTCDASASLIYYQTDWSFFQILEALFIYYKHNVSIGNTSCYWKTILTELNPNEDCNTVHSHFSNVCHRYDHISIWGYFVSVHLCWIRPRCIVTVLVMSKQQGSLKSSSKFGNRFQNRWVIKEICPETFPYKNTFTSTSFYSFILFTSSKV